MREADCDDESGPAKSSQLAQCTSRSVMSDACADAVGRDPYTYVCSSTAEQRYSGTAVRYIGVGFVVASPRRRIIGGPGLLSAVHARKYEWRRLR